MQSSLCEVQIYGNLCSFTLRVEQTGNKLQLQRSDSYTLIILHAKTESFIVNDCILKFKLQCSSLFFIVSRL